jgi:hypothetical protein
LTDLGNGNQNVLGDAFAQQAVALGLKAHKKSPQNQHPTLAGVAAEKFETKRQAPQRWKIPVSEDQRVARVTRFRERWTHDALSSFTG